MNKYQGQFKIQGLSPATVAGVGCWMRDRGQIRFLSNQMRGKLSVSGERLTFDATEHSGLMRKPIGLEIRLNQKTVGSCLVDEQGAFEWAFDLSEGSDASVQSYTLHLQLKGVALTNFLALCGRLLKNQIWLPKSLRQWLQPFRKQPSNRAFLIQKIKLGEQVLVDFSKPHEVFSQDFIQTHAKPGLNIIGWFHGFLGVGESARACAQAARCAGFETQSVGLKLHLNGGQSEALWNEATSGVGQYGITIAHVDAPQSLDLREKHPVEMADDCYRIGYWAWELPEFPDGWIQYASVFNEIWCPSEFCREAMAQKLPIPVLAMPHAIRPGESDHNQRFWRQRFSLDQDQFQFLFSFDLNSYAPRKRPEAVVEAFKLAFAGSQRFEAGLVLKMHGKGYGDFTRESIYALKTQIPNLTIIDEMLSREEMTGLQVACDAFVSLHRSEGFGLGPAEMMALGKPVISTNWSATSEFIDASVGCPVDYKLVELTQNVGPYTQGQIWAEADVTHAASWMTRLYEDRSLATKLGEAARERMKNRYSTTAIGKLYWNRIKSVALF